MLYEVITMGLPEPRSEQVLAPRFLFKLTTIGAVVKNKDYNRNNFVQHTLYEVIRVTVVEFDAEVQRYATAQTALGNQVDPSVASATVADDFIAQLLLAQAARTNGFVLDDAGLQARVDSSYNFV